MKSAQPAQSVTNTNTNINTTPDTRNVVPLRPYSSSPSTPDSAPPRMSSDPYACQCAPDIPTYHRLTTPAIFRRRTQPHKRRIVVPRADLDEIEALRKRPFDVHANTNMNVNENNHHQQQQHHPQHANTHLHLLRPNPAITQSHSPTTPQSAPPRIRLYSSQSPQSSTHPHTHVHTLDIHSYRRLVTPPIFRRRRPYKRRILVPRADLDEIQALRNISSSTQPIPSTPSSLPPH